MNTNDNYSNRIKQYQDFGERLDYVMTLRKITNNDLAEVLICTPSTVSGYRTGRRSPNVITQKEICRALNVSADYLLGLSDDPNL